MYQRYIDRGWALPHIQGFSHPAQQHRFGEPAAHMELPSGAGGEAIEAARADEVVEGDAEILCTIDGQGIGRYKIRISNIDHSGREIKNFVVTIVDERLIEKTGGIVQGMSGSPIIQNGKLVGAVTHVCVRH